MFVCIINLFMWLNEGNVVVGGCDLMLLLVGVLCEVCCEIGMIFQYFNLLLLCMVFDNVVLLFELVGVSCVDIEVVVLLLFDLVGLFVQKDCYLLQISGGQKQCVGIVCVLVSQLKVLLLDEVMFVFDFEIMCLIFDLLKCINCEFGLMIVLIMYQMEVIKQVCDCVVVFDVGCVVEEGCVIDVFLQLYYEVMCVLIGDVIVQELLFVLKVCVVEWLKMGSGYLLWFVFMGLGVDQLILLEMICWYEFDFNILYGQIDEIQGQVFGLFVVFVGGELGKVGQVFVFLCE